MSLTPEQIQNFKDQGFVIAPIFDDADMEPVIAAIEQAVSERAGQFKDQGRIADLAEHLPFDRRLSYLREQCPAIAGNIDILDLKLKAMFDFFFNTHLLDVLASLLGPEIMLNPIGHLRAKMPAGKEQAGGAYLGDVDWHQDAAVMWEETDQTDVLTVWIPLVNASRENGCMQLIPGVHGDHVCMEHTSKSSIAHLPDVQPVVGTCPKGSAVIMGQFTPHMGLPNTSDTIRWTMDLRFQRTGTPTGRPFYPSFVVASEKNPASVENDFDAWCQAWDAVAACPVTVPWHRSVARADRDAKFAQWQDQQKVSTP